MTRTFVWFNIVAAEEGVAMKEDVAVKYLEQFNDKEVRFIYAAILYILRKREQEQVRHRSTAP